MTPSASCFAERANPSLERGPPPAWHLAREALAVYHSLRGPSTTPVVSAQLKR
jgi:hypothetical protein